MSKKIAVVNDDTTFLTLMCDLLSFEGFEAYTVVEAGSAYKKLKETLPDAIILDIRFGQEQESGWHVLELIKLDPALEPLPVIVCSADVRAIEERVALLERHGCQVLQKPFTLEELLSMLRSVL